jgi:hypothetical protein
MTATATARGLTMHDHGKGYLWAWPVRRDGARTGEYLTIRGTKAQIRHELNFDDKMLAELEFLPPGDQRRELVDIAFGPGEGEGE